MGQLMFFACSSRLLEEKTEAEHCDKIETGGSGYFKGLILKVPRTCIHRESDIFLCSALINNPIF